MLPAREFPLDVDVGHFRASSGLSRLEVYYGIARDRVTYQEKRGGYTAQLAAVVMVIQRGQIIDFREMSIKDE